MSTPFFVMITYSAKIYITMHKATMVRENNITPNMYNESSEDKNNEYILCYRF